MIEVAQSLTREVFVIAVGKQQRERLLEKMCLNPERVYSNDDVSLASKLSTAAAGLGFDVVVYSARGKFGSEVFDLCAEFGRFVHLKDRGLDVNLNQVPFATSKNIMISSFDLMSLYARSQKQKGGKGLIWQT